MAIEQVKVRGKKRWQARVAYHGGRQSRLCDSKEEAKTAEAELLQSLRADAEQKEQEGEAPLVLLCEAYALDLEARQKSPDSVRRAQDTQARLTEFFGGRMKEPLTRLREQNLYAFKAHRLQHGAKASTVNRDFRSIRAMLKRAMPTFRFPSGLFLKEDEPHVVLNAEAHASEWVFPNPDNRPYSRVHVGREWRKAARAVGLRDFHFHDLRHHGATQALNAGYSAPIVMALGGWKTERMMRRYAAVADKTLRAAAEAVSGNGGNGAWQRSAILAPALVPVSPSRG